MFVSVRNREKVKATENVVSAKSFHTLVFRVKTGSACLPCCSAVIIIIILLLFYADVARITISSLSKWPQRNLEGVSFTILNDNQ